MKQTTCCFGKQQLQALLSGELEKEGRDVITRHVEWCVRCQQRLDVLTQPKVDPRMAVSMRQAWSELFEKQGAARELSSGKGRMHAEITNYSTNAAAKFETQQSIAAVEVRQPKPRIAGYEIGEVIARGGMGTIYRARQLKLDRNVAIKFMHRSGTGDVARFDREMRAIGQLKDEHIVIAHDAGEAEGVPYIVTELLEGEDLSRAARARGIVGRPEEAANCSLLKIERACGFVRQAAFGLNTAHAAGIVHRDVKPSNLFLTTKGVVKLLDLGLAIVDREQDFNGEITDATSIMGSLDYIAPEQGRDSRAADIRSDVYGLGCTLYTLLTGMPPFAGAEFNTSAKKLLAHACEPRPDVRRVRPEVPLALAQLVQTMMSVNPEDRPQTAAAAAELLAPFCGNSVRLRIAGGRRLAPIVAACAALLMFCGVLIVLKSKEGTKRRIATGEDVQSISLQRVSHEKTVSAERPDDAFDLEDHPNYVRTLFGHTNAISAFAFLPHGRQAVSVGQDARCILWEVDTGAVAKMYNLETPHRSMGLAVSQDGRDLYLGDGTGMGRLSLAEEKFLWNAGSQANVAIAVTGDGLVAHSTLNGIFLRKDDDLRFRRFGRGIANAADPAFSHDNQSLLYIDRSEKSVVIRTMPDGEQVGELSTENFAPRYARFMSGDKHIVAIDAENTAVVWNLESGQIIQRRVAEWTSDQHLLLQLGDSDRFATLRAGNRQLVIWDAFTGIEHGHIDLPSTKFVALSPEGRYALTSDDTPGRKRERGSNVLRLWRLPETLWEVRQGLSSRD